MRLGHISEKNLKVLSERNLLCEYVANELNVCRCCGLDQWQKVQFSTIIKETTEIAELMHLGVRRLSRFPSRKSDIAMLTVVDDYSRKTWVLCLGTSLMLLSGSGS